MKNSKILFLGNKDCSLLNWLISQGEDVIQTTEKISLPFLNKHKIVFIISYGYRHIITQEVIQAYKNSVINLHISLLPWNKGCSPNVWSFIENTPKGVSIHYIDEGIDTGDIIAQQEVFFSNESDTLSSSYEILQQTLQALFKKNWYMIKTNTCKRNAQRGTGSLHRLNDEKVIFSLLNNGWHTSIAELKNLVSKMNHP